MSALDFEMVRLGLSQQDRDGWLALQRIEKLQGELITALEGVAHFAWTAVRADCEDSRLYLGSLIDDVRVALAKAREDAPDASEEQEPLTRSGGPQHCSQEVPPPRGSLCHADPRPVEDMDE